MDILEHLLSRLRNSSSEPDQGEGEGHVDTDPALGDVTAEESAESTDHPSDAEHVTTMTEPGAEPEPMPDEVGEATEDEPPEETGTLCDEVPDAQKDPMGKGDEGVDVAQEAADATKSIWETDNEAYLASGITSDGEEPKEDEDDGTAVSFRDGENIEPIGFDAPFAAGHATGEMLTNWHLRLVYDHDMPDGDDEPIVELYDGETGEFVSDYWVSTFCDNSDEREGQGLACKGAVKRFRIMYDDLLGMQGLVRPVPAVDKWYADHEGDMPDHDV